MSGFEVGRPRPLTHGYTPGSSAPLCGRDAPLHEEITRGAVPADEAIKLTTCPRCRQILLEQHLSRDEAL